MKKGINVIEITDEYILFDNGKKIETYHDQDCCECNYADFKAITDVIKQLGCGEYYPHFEEPLIFEAVPGYGFRFGNEYKMIFVPCYSFQNGYYSNAIGVLYDGKDVFGQEFLVNEVND